MSRASRMLSTTGFVALQLASPCRAGREHANCTAVTDQVVFLHRPDQSLEPIEPRITPDETDDTDKSPSTAGGVCSGAIRVIRGRQVCGLRLAVAQPLRSRSSLHIGTLSRWLDGCASVES